MDLAAKEIRCYGRGKDALSRFPFKKKIAAQCVFVGWGGRGGNKDTDAPSCQLLLGLPQLQRTSSPEALPFLRQPAYGDPQLLQISVQVILEIMGRIEENQFKL